MEYSIQSDACRTTLKLWGRFDLRGMGRQKFFEALQDCQAENPKEIIIDLREVSFLDSSAIGLLMVAHKRCQVSSIVLSICVSEGNVKKTLDFLKIPDIVSVVTKP